MVLEFLRYILGNFTPLFLSHRVCVVKKCHFLSPLLQKSTNNLDVTALWLKNACVLRDQLIQRSVKQARQSLIIINFL